ncbi:PREDICTED: uncharacterized protein LOC104722909 [Camelina sativa]|uniref:Uncharacterized protein LOC104722909 n=1 Tax=Camelina sativa TaxID=90675 RepID=A0ABM0UD97_CAMSA|nr:PREDICTED: uncharacterized protein LOC104722909 [Camelina sativa]
MGEEETEQVSSSFFSHPLFSCFITLYFLILIYFPNDLLRISLSPVLLISGALLLSLLYLGSTREPNIRPETRNENLEEKAKNYSNAVLIQDSDKNPDHLPCGFVEWNLRAPLEVIHEAYEENDDEDEEEEENPGGEKDPTRFKEIVRFPSLSLCYPESDSDSDSDSASSSEFKFPEIGDWNSPGFRWEEEEDDDDGGGTGRREGLIEMKFDCSYNNNKSKMIMSKWSKWNQTELEFYGEDEDGLIEINLFS